MSLQVENLEKNMAKMTVEVPAENLEKAIKSAYNNNKKRFNIPGFRRGKAPLPMIEKMYGVEVFYEEAANIILDESYPDAAKESGLEIVSRPEIELVQIEKGKPFIYTATVAVKPEVTLGDYKGIQVERAAADVTDEDVENELKRVQNQNSRLLTIEDRPVQDGDQVVIDFDGYMDGQPFDGGKSEDYSLTIGSHSFIDTFEEQLIGKNIGEACEVNVTFPEEYHVKDLAGKPAMFKVVVKEIKMKELPELNDEFAEEVSEFDTLDEYRADIRSKLLERKQKEAATENENRVVEKVVENASMEIPEKMLETQVQNMINDYARRMQSQGMSMDQYMQYTGMTMESLEEQTKPQAEKSIRTRLVLEAVVKAEAIQVTDEAVEEELKKMADTYRMDIEKVKELMGERELKQMREDLAVQEAIDFLVAEAELV